ncbi:MAG: UDP-N-acetylmuramate--L-alanine ligase [Anaerolineae bacterium]|jgi:UDP-N-acetylmuramate--alanine ligase|nr:UDP-N-acetylmuramate--L-alanine ligase [Anaerolineae bacterium]
MIQLIPGQHIHFVGIGGYGMSAIARLLLLQGFTISGSDAASNDLTEALKREGATIYRGHDATYVEGAEMVIVTSAVMDDHIEVLSARAEGIPVYRRQDFISTLLEGYRTIAVAGTHGKTTTTAMTAHILLTAGLKPSYIVGGVMGNTGTNAGMGDSNLFVIEADEYGNMFHGLRPQVEVLTSIEYDHPDFFLSPRDMMESFSHFVGLLPRDGLLVACADDTIAGIYANHREIVSLPVATYGINHPAAAWRAENLRFEGEKTFFEVTYKGHRQGAVTLQVPGRHNILNALAALIVAVNQNVKFTDAAAALAGFKATGRRFDVRAYSGGIAVVDDYAHHPTAIRATIEAARLRYPGHDIWAVWQPHTYSRTLQLMDGYLAAFDRAQHVLVTEIFAAREKPVDDVSGADIVRAMNHPHARFVPMLDDAVETLLAGVRAPAVVLVLSAGDAVRISRDYVAGLEAKGGT